MRKLSSYMKYIDASSFAVFKRWLPLGFAITAVFLFIYVLAHQELRSGANDLQVSLGREVVSRLESGTPVGDILKHETRDISVTLSPYVIIYDKDGKPISGTGTLGGILPTPPQGVFRYLSTHGEDRFTWEPARGVRHGVVGLYFKGNENTQPFYVLAGRSLQEAEERIWQLSLITMAMWSIAMLGSLVLSILLS